MLTEVVSPGEVNELVTVLSGRIADIHAPHIWIVMDGGFMFGADLLRRVRGVKKVSFIYVERGYGRVGGPHEPYIYHANKPPVFLTKYTHVFLDVVTEVGATFEKLLELVPDRQRGSTITCALISKGYKPKLCGRTLSKEMFLTGYGMSPYRHLPYIAERKEK